MFQSDPDRVAGADGQLHQEGLRIWKLERVKGIEPSSQPWEGHILPLNHTRALQPPSLNKTLHLPQRPILHPIPLSPVLGAQIAGPQSARRESQLTSADVQKLF